MSTLKANNANRRSVSVLLLVLAVIAVAVAYNWLQSGHQVRPINASLTVVNGQATVSRADAGSEQLTTNGQTALVQNGDALATGGASAAILTCAEGARLELGENTAVTLLEISRTGIARETSVGISLDRGSVVGRLAGQFLQGIQLRIETRVATVDTAGGVLQCAVLDNQRVTVSVYEGAATVTMGGQSVALAANQTLQATLGQPLLPMTANSGAPAPLPEVTASLAIAPAQTTPSGPATQTPDNLFPKIVTPTRPGDDATLYTVQSGDTLYSIATKHGVSWEAIWQTNKQALPKPELLRVGQQLRIPKP
jgi:hypothetical protein